MQYVAFGERRVRRELHTRLAPGVAVVGLALALAVTFLPLLAGRPVLTHWPPPDATVIHLGRVELLPPFVFDIGVFLLVLGFTVTGLTLVARTEAREAP
jgi:multisubunit Na+/H+ antiporter MnhB subunit